MLNQNKKRQGKIRIPKKKRVGFVCSGGAIKAGAFHIGVALGLREHGFRFKGGLLTSRTEHSAKPQPMEIDTYVGSSAGALISSLLASGFAIEEIFDAFMNREGAQEKPRIPRLTYSKIFKLRPELAKEQLAQLLNGRKLLKDLMKGKWETLLNTEWFKITGFFSTSGIESYMREEVLPSNQFEDYAADLFIVGTQLNHSRKVVFGRSQFDPPAHDPTCQYITDVTVSDAVAASIALPPFFSPYHIRTKSGKRADYIDGEIRDTLSSHVADDAGCDLVIASYTHQPYHYVKEVGSLTKLGLSAIIVQSLYLMIEQKINHYIHTRRSQKKAIEEVEAYCKQAGLDPKHRSAILGIMEERFAFRREVDTIYIHPRPSDTRMFIREHFSLSTQVLQDIVLSGFRAATEVLKHYEFEDLDLSPPT